MACNSGRQQSGTHNPEVWRGTERKGVTPSIASFERKGCAHVFGLPRHAPILFCLVWSHRVLSRNGVTGESGMCSDSQSVFESLLIPCATSSCSEPRKRKRNFVQRTDLLCFLSFCWPFSLPMRSFAPSITCDLPFRPRDHDDAARCFREVRTLKKR